MLQNSIQPNPQILSPEPKNPLYTEKKWVKNEDFTENACPRPSMTLSAEERINADQQLQIFNCLNPKHPMA